MIQKELMSGSGEETTSYWYVNPPESIYIEKRLPEVRIWCHRTFGSRNWIEGWYFTNKEDATLFQLTWGMND